MHQRFLQPNSSSTAMTTGLNCWELPTSISEKISKTCDVQNYKTKRPHRLTFLQPRRKQKSPIWQSCFWHSIHLLSKTSVKNKAAYFCEIPQHRKQRGSWWLALLQITTACAQKMFCRKKHGTDTAVAKLAPKEENTFHALAQLTKCVAEAGTQSLASLLPKLEETNRGKWRICGTGGGPAVPMPTFWIIRTFWPDNKTGGCFRGNLSVTRQRWGWTKTMTKRACRRFLDGLCSVNSAPEKRGKVFCPTWWLNFRKTQGLLTINLDPGFGSKGKLVCRKKTMSARSTTASSSKVITWNFANESPTQGNSWRRQKFPQISNKLVVTLSNFMTTNRENKLKRGKFEGIFLWIQENFDTYFCSVDVSNSHTAKLSKKNVLRLLSWIRGRKCKMFHLQWEDKKLWTRALISVEVTQQCSWVFLEGGLLHLRPQPQGQHSDNEIDDRMVRWLVLDTPLSAARPKTLCVCHFP